MGQPDQFAKRTFASDAELVTGGAFRFQDSPEASLTWVRADGLLIVQKPEAVLALPAPWSEARGHLQIVVEVKMPRDSINAIVLDRVELRRLARQIQRAEDPKDGWLGEQALWTVAPHVPDILEKRRTVTKLAPGCYRVGPHPFDYLWIAANELPLREELIPFLIVRSGKALREFALWVAKRRPVPWLLDMVRFTRMTTAVQDELRATFEAIDDPEMLENWLAWGRKLIELTPELQREGRREGQLEGRLDEARSLLRRVLARRKLEVSAGDTARIDACTDLTTLERWLEEAVTAPSAAEALQ